MKLYPSIDSYSQEIIQDLIQKKVPVFIFYKYDGSNIRAEANAKGQWYKFGSRTQLIGRDFPVLGEAIDLFKVKYGDCLSQRWLQVAEKNDRCVAYFEFYGPNSFAGGHDTGDPKEVVLFDLDFYKIGLLGPSKFLEVISTIGKPCAQLLYQGVLTWDLVECIQSNTFTYPLFEGVIIKWDDLKNKTKLGGMVKIKTNSYKEKLKIKYQEAWEKYL